MPRHTLRSAFAGASFVVCASLSLVCSRVLPPQTQKQAENSRAEGLHRAPGGPVSLVFPADDPGAWSPREAYEFIKAIPLFESSGLIVRVPDWWNARKPVRPVVSVKIDSKHSAGIGVDAMMRFSVGMSLDGETLSPDEIAQLLESSGGLVPLKGKWVEVDQEKLKQALEHWKGIEKDVRRSGVSFFEGMRLLSGAMRLVRNKGDA